MTTEIYYFLLIQAALVAVVYAVFFRRTNVPSIVKLLVVAAYITIPVAILIKGMASAIYINDLIVPVLILYFLKRPRRLEILLMNRYFLAAAAFLIILPLIWGSILVISGEHVLTARDWLEKGVWFYRNFVYLLVFGVGLSLMMNREQVKGFIEMNLGFGALLAILGLVSYFGPFNMATFETIRWGGIVPEWFRENRMGLGFLGLFRGSVGQWFAMLVLLAVGSYYFVSPKFRKVALVVIIAGIGVILLSFSRIGFVGLIIGLLVLALSKVKSRRKMALVAALFAVTFFGVFGGDALRERFFEVEQIQVAAFGEAAVQRVAAWEASIRHFSEHPHNFLIGIGPADREAIYEITGIFGPHNEYLDVIYRMGVFGLIMLLWFLFIILLKFLWVRSRAESFAKPVLWGLIAIIIANSAMALTQSHLLHDYATHTLGFYIFLLYGVFIGARWNEWVEITSRKINV